MTAFFYAQMKGDQAVTNQLLEEPDDSEETASLMPSPSYGFHAYDSSELFQSSSLGLMEGFLLLKLLF